jgi:hypothetical protein
MKGTETGTSAAEFDSADVISQRNREHSQHGRRKQRTSLSFNDAEWAVIEQAAALEGLRAGAYVSRMGLDAARARVTGSTVDRGVLTQLYEALTHHSNQLAKIGGNLNDVARHANSTHEVETVREQALAIMEIVRRRVIESGGLHAAVRHALR